jgi:AraC-like DNA-binding protein
VSVLHVTDPTAVGDSLAYDMDVINLDPEQFEYKQVTVPLEGCVLIYQHTKKSMRTRSRIYENLESCFVLGPNARGSIDGMELRPYSMIAAGPGAHAELVLDDDFAIVGWLAPPQVLGKHLDLRGKKGNFAIPVAAEVWHPAKDEARSLFELGTRISATAENSAEVFDDSRWARYGAQVEYMDSLLATIESFEPGGTVETVKKKKSYSEIVRTCEDFTLNLDGRRPYMSELCETANVSERTVQKAFQDIMGMSPLTFLHRLRLHRAREELRKANSDTTTVTEVATNWGFWHFGEFSRAYKNCFGEVPSRTLKDNIGD